MSLRNPPYAHVDQLNNELDDTFSKKSGRQVPGLPLQKIDSDQLIVLDCLHDDLETPDLDVLAPHLWLMTTSSSSNISPLHHQRIKGRKIFITENPGLHLVWIDNRIFIKPLPKYLLSHAFWTELLLPRSTSNAKSILASYPAQSSNLDDRKDSIVRASLGLLRSYRYLIKHSSDLDLALEYHLLPENTTFDSFSRFASHFMSIADCDVSPRYSFGELRLTRLNFWCKIFLSRWDYERVHYQYAQYFQRFYGPFLFVFGCLSVILSAMQVELAVEGIQTALWQDFWKFCRAFSLFSLLFISGCIVILISLLLTKLCMELVYTIKHRKTLKLVV